MSNLLTSLRHNRTSLQELTLDDLPKSKYRKQRHSAINYLYLYIIGVAVSAFVFVIELVYNFCNRIKFKFSF